MLRAIFSVAFFAWAVTASAQTLEWETRAHQWTTTMRGVQPCSEGPSCPEFWMTDLPSAPGWPDAQNYTLPSWMPQKVFITYVRIRAEQVTNGQIAASIDYDRVCYNTGMPPYHQSGAFNGFCDWSRNSGLVSLPIGGQELVRNYWPPKLLDRSKDSIWLQSDNQSPGMVSLDIGFIIPATAQPTGLIVPPPPPPPDPNWAPIFGPLELNNVSSGWGGYTFAATVQPSALNQVSPGGQTRVTIQGPGLQVGRLFVQGHQVTFAGQAGSAANSSGLLTSDAMPFAINTAAPVLVKGYVTSGSLSFGASAVPGVASAYVLGDDAASAGTAGYTAGSAGPVGLKSIEVHQ